MQFGITQAHSCLKNLSGVHFVFKIELGHDTKWFLNNFQYPITVVLPPVIPNPCNPPSDLPQYIPKVIPSIYNLALQTPYTSSEGMHWNYSPTRHPSRPIAEDENLGQNEKCTVHQSLDTRCNSSFAMVPRCTSSGPSASRRVRALAHKWANGKSELTPPPPWTWMALSNTRNAVFGAATFRVKSQPLH